MDLLLLVGSNKKHIKEVMCLLYYPESFFIDRLKFKIMSKYQESSGDNKNKKKNKKVTCRLLDKKHNKNIIQCQYTIYEKHIKHFYILTVLFIFLI